MIAAVAARQFSHVALGVGRGEGPLALVLLRALGLDVRDNGPSLRGDPWYTAVIDADQHDGDMGNLGFFVIPISDAQVALEQALTDSPLVQALRSEKQRKPDSSPHVALHYTSLDQLEEAIATLEVEDALAGRFSLLRYRPQSAVAGLDFRLDASPVFANADRVRYLSEGVQIFLQTDVVSAGLLALGQSFELNWVSP